MLALAVSVDEDSQPTVVVEFIGNREVLVERDPREENRTCHGLDPSGHATCTLAVSLEVLSSRIFVKWGAVDENIDSKSGDGRENCHG